jgi:uncharacterized protein YbcI
MPDHPPSVKVAIANLVVRTTSEYTGRGPTRARTYIVDDLVSVVLENSLTKGENRLVADGHHDKVEAMRLAFQKSMRDDLVTGVEDILGRRVRAFLSANHMSPDISIETFLLEPE